MKYLSNPRQIKIIPLDSNWQVKMFGNQASNSIVCYSSVPESRLVHGEDTQLFVTTISSLWRLLAGIILSVSGKFTFQKYQSMKTMSTSCHKVTKFPRKVVETIQEASNSSDLKTRWWADNYMAQFMTFTYTQTIETRSRPNAQKIGN